MLDLLWAAANDGTGHRAALATPTFGKTGTTQDNRDALFVGFAGNLVVGVWVGRDDNGSLGKITGGSAPAQIWRRFHGQPAIVDRRTARAPHCQGSSGSRTPPARTFRRKSPLPDEWSEGGETIREIIDLVEQIIDAN